MSDRYPSIGTKWICAQNGGMKIKVISQMNDLNYDEDGSYKRTGDIIYVYSDNNKVGQMKQYNSELWNKEWLFYNE